MLNLGSQRFLASLAAFVFSAAQIVLIALYPVLAENLAIGLPALIGSFSLGSLLFLFGNPYWSNRSDTWGRDRVLTIGLAGLFVSFASVLFLIGSRELPTSILFAVLLAGRILYGLVASAVAPVAQSIQADLGGETPARAMALHSMSLTAGRVAGLFAVVFFHENYVSILLAGTVFIGLVTIAQALAGRSTSLPSATFARNSSWREEALDIRWVLAIAFAFTCFVECLNASLAAALKNLLEIEGTQASGFAARVLLIASIGILAVQSFARRLPQARARAGLWSGVFALAAGALAFVFVNGTVSFWFAIALFAIGIGLVPPTYLSLLKAGAPTSHYGRRAGLVGSAHTLGYAGGGALAAISLRFADVPMGFALFLPAVVLGVFCFLEGRKSNPKAEALA